MDVISRRLLKALVLGAGIFAGLIAAVTIAYIIWPLETFNTLMIKDPARVVARDLAYGPAAKQRYDLYAPLDGEKWPILVFVHGGSWDAGGKDGYDFVGYAFASRGYLTAMITYRLVPEVHYPGFVEDTAKAIEHIRSEASKHGGDPSRVYLVGHSAGAYNAVQAALNPAFGLDRKTIRAIAGIAGPYVFPTKDHPTIQKAFGKYEAFEDTQPAKFLTPNSPPLVLVHGADDDIVKPDSSRAFFDEAKKVGMVVELHVHPATNHISILGDLSRPFRYRSPTFENIITFFSRHP